MIYGISPWLLSIDTPLMAMPFGLDSYARTLDTYFSAYRAGEWATRWPAPHTFGYRFADQAPQYWTHQFSGGYPPDLESRAVSYIRSAILGQILPHWNRPATAYDAFNTAQHAEITRGEQSVGADGREKSIWDLADSCKEWLGNDIKRADFEAAFQTAAGKDITLQLANLIQPGTTELTQELAQAVAQRLRPTEMPASKSAAEVVAAYVQKLGGESVVRAMCTEVRNWVWSRGVDWDAGVDLTQKGYRSPEIRDINTQLRDKGFASRRLFLNQLGDVKAESIDTDRAKKEYEQNVRVACLRAMAVKAEEDIKALLKKYKGDNLADFLKHASSAVAARRIS